MISRVDGSQPKSLGDLELKQNDVQRNKSKTGKSATAESESPEISEFDEDTATRPVHVRHLGRNLDLIG